MVKASGTQLQLLKKTVDAIHPLSETEWLAFSEQWKQKEIGKKQVLTAPGFKECHLYFVVEGVQRIFSLHESDRESTLLFTYAPSFGGVIDSLLLQQPSRFYYETLSSSVLLTLSYEHLVYLAQVVPAVNEFMRKALTISLSGLLDRMVELQSLTAEERFRKLLQRSPHILQLVPQKYLANYIGIDATNFSKLMNSVRI